MSNLLHVRWRVGSQQQNFLRLSRQPIEWLGRPIMKSLLLGTILGGLAAFTWSTISWTVLPWHQKPMLHFQNEDEVSAVVASHAPQSGIYILPAGPSQEGM